MYLFMPENNKINGMFITKFVNLFSICDSSHLFSQSVRHVFSLRPASKPRSPGLKSISAFLINAQLLAILELATNF